jgi:hypothetical protein
MESLPKLHLQFIMVLLLVVAAGKTSIGLTIAFVISKLLLFGF